MKAKKVIEGTLYFRLLKDLNRVIWILKRLTYSLDLLQLGLLLLDGLLGADLLTLVHPGAGSLLDHGQDLQTKSG